MDQRIKKGIFYVISVPLLLYLVHFIYSEINPNHGSGGNVPATMDSAPKVSESVNVPTPPVPAKPVIPNPASTAAPPQGSPAPVTSPNAAPNANQPKPGDPPKTEPEKPIVLSSLFNNNPFVEMNILQEEHKKELAMLPAIPSNVPVPNVSNVPIPPPPGNITIPTPPSGMNSAPTLTGTIESSNGERIALMSDGKVVSEGDNYGDSQIAYIGGGSVQFDDGKTMDLVNSIQVNRTK